MARQRRGGGFRPPELRGTLGTLIRTTLEQASVVRDAIGRSAREGRSRLDEALSHRRRKDALAELGELILDLIRRGEIDLAELPEARALVRALDDLDGDAADPAAESDEPDDRIAQPPTRGRFDARDPSRSRAPSHARDPNGDGDDDDGTVSATRGAVSPTRGTVSPTRGTVSAARGAVSATRGSSGPASDRWSPPKPAAPQRVWRPSLVDDEPPSEPLDSRGSSDSRDSRDSRDSHDPSDPHAPLHPPAARSLPRDPHRKGGIRFDDDEDLADYMHPDDVPPKPPADGDR